MRPFRPSHCFAIQLLLLPHTAKAHIPTHVCTSKLDVLVWEFNDVYQLLTSSPTFEEINGSSSVNLKLNQCTKHRYVNVTSSVNLKLNQRVYTTLISKHFVECESEIKSMCIHNIDM
jgi:hypothetical protein